MKPAYELISFHIIEKFNNSSLITWTYPSLSDLLKQFLLGKSLLNKQENYDFVYHRVDKQWVYLWKRSKEQKCYTLGLVTKCYHPDKYKQFGLHLCNVYEQSFKPIELVQVFLGAFTNGSYKVQQNGTRCNMNFNTIANETVNHQHYLELVNLFHIELILIFNALLLKKRIFLYHSNFVQLLKFVEVITRLLDWKMRDPNEYLYPHYATAAVQGRSFFLAGLTDTNINLKPATYDLLVNCENGTIKISPNSKDVFQMTKWHKEIALLLTQQDDENPDRIKATFQELHSRTGELLKNLKAMATKEQGVMITLEELRAKKMPPAMENFLFNLAIAEGIMML